MKITVNKSAKRVLSLVLAIVMLVGSLFVANIGGTQITASAATATTGIDLLEFGQYLVDAGSTSTYYDTNVADNGETGDSWENAIIIDSAEEFVYLSKASGNETAGKYYKVADGITGFDLSGGNLDYNGSLADNLAKIKSGGKNHAGGDPGFQGHFDGNNAVVYGAWTNHTTGNISGYAGLFTATKGGVTIKNIHVKLASFTATSAAGGIIGYSKADSMCTITVENCSVTDSHIEVTASAWGNGAGAIIGRGGSASSYKETESTGDVNGNGTIGDTIYVNVAYNIKNCYVNLDENYFITKDEGTSVAGHQVCHGGVVGVCDSNALTVQDCLVIGITPYATSISNNQNAVQHSGLETHFKNVYTTADVAITGVNIGGTLTNRNFTGKVFPLTDDKLKGSAAINNMTLDWFGAWIPGAEGEYPKLAPKGYVSDLDFWDGTAATEYAGGTGTKEDPFIIKTAEQLYKAVSEVTGKTSGVASSESTEVTGGYQSGTMLKQGSTTDYVAVYTPYYYKVDSSIKSLYLNSVYGNETLAGIKQLVADKKAKNWHPQKSFVGHLDGNGVTIYGLCSTLGQGLIYKLDGAADVKNIHFAAGYSSGTGNAAMLTTTLGSYSNDTTYINISNISVRNCYVGTTRGASSSNAYNSDKDHYGTVGGVVSSQSTCENLTISNCFFDGYSCEMVIGANCVGTVASGYVSTYGGIISGGTGMNNTLITGCVSLGAPAVDEVYDANVDYKYTRYDANQGFQVFFYDSYTDYPSTLTNKRPGQYDKLLEFARVDKKDVYETFDFAKLAWGNWELTEVENGRVIPMPVANTSDAETIGSYMQVIGAGQNKYAGVGPYAYGANPYTWLLKGAGTEEDPYLIETDEQLARAIATGGMNLYDKLYYKLANDIDISGGKWITQDTRAEGGIYYVYTPFGGTLDGDGHTITGLSAGDDASAGLIPVLDGGTVKNLHLKDASVISREYAGVIAGKMLAGNIIDCSIEDFTVSSKLGTKTIVGFDTDDYDDEGIFGSWDPVGDGITKGEISNVYAINGEDIFYRVVIDEETGEVCHYGTGTLVDEYDESIENWDIDDSVWYVGGKEGSVPQLRSLAVKMDYADVDGDGVGNEYSTNDLISLRQKLLRKSAYKNIYGDVSRDGKINVADLAILQRTIVKDYGTSLDDDFFANLQAGRINIYYGENDNYDAARKLELYIESVIGTDVYKYVSTENGTVTGANSDNTKVYVHEGDQVGNPDGTLDIIVGDVVGYTAASGMAANTYEVTYDSASKFVWIKGQNFTAVEQAVLNFINESNRQGDVVYTCGVTELENYKKPVTVKLDTNYDGVIDKDVVHYYAWGDEFDSDTVDTYNWQHNTQQTEGMSGDVNSSYKDQEVAPVAELNKLLTIENGKLMMKRGYRKGTGGYTADINGVVALDVTDSYNGYNDLNDNPAIQDDDNYFTSGKVTTERGMLYKQGYIEFSGRLPADGHAFPAWWLMARPSQSATNHGYDNSLYGKVYKLNTNRDDDWKWNGSDEFIENNPATFKYQLPSAIYEIDMIEVMQHVNRHRTKAGESEWGINLGGSRYNNDYKTRREAVNLYYLNTTIHKWWNNGVDNNKTADTSDDRLYIIDWENKAISSGITNSAFNTTSSADSWIHNPGSTEYDFGTPTENYWGTPYYKTQTFDQTAHDNLTAERRYGFSWYTNGTGFEATLYIYNGNTLLTTVPIASGDSDGVHAFMDNDKKLESKGIIGTVDGGKFKDVYSDAKVFNQYMYILFDNKYYSSNQNMSSNSVFTDLLTSMGLKTFEIDYVRVYQQDGKRDIVTQETQSFNNNNHFGY